MKKWTWEPIEQHSATLKYTEELKALHSMKYKLLGIWTPLSFKWRDMRKPFCERIVLYKKVLACVQAMQGIDRLRAMLEDDLRERNGLPPTPPPNYEFNYWQSY